MNFKKVNNITGWVICAIASLVYILTAEKSGSFWDCGEFIACAYKLQVSHQPGYPLFAMICKVFSLLSMGDTTKVAYFTNMACALASGATIMFLYWTVTLIARKMMLKNGGIQLHGADIFFGRLVIFPAREIGGPQITVEAGALLVELNGLSIFLDGRAKFFHLVMHGAQIVMGLRIFAVHSYGALEFPPGLGIPLEQQQRNPNLVMKDRAISFLHGRTVVIQGVQIVFLAAQHVALLFQFRKRSAGRGRVNPLNL